MSDTAIAVIGTLVAGLGGTALGWWLNARTGLQRWRQDQRLEVYVALLSVLERARDAARAPYFTGLADIDYNARIEAYREAFRAVDDAVIKVKLLGSTPMRTVLADLAANIGVAVDPARQPTRAAAGWTLLSDQFDAIYRRFDAAARHDLRLRD